MNTDTSLPKTSLPKTLQLQIDARGVATLTLNRPEVANAYDETMLRAMTACMHRLAADTRCGCW